ncbi:probable ADP,ATP carrier protein At5g56450 [Lolium rigidum]|uniref:probable ADP,ATP carrier protein At5g56450 n=1 Tax=Lolium rigidum TaxID=89674 RepID=UPI001F5D82A8|nr:probable ADP,ATP carrier protein At5g56450 [Lolium rigidum]
MSEEAAAAPPPARPGAADDDAAAAYSAAALRAGRAWEFKRDLAAGALMGGAVHTVVAPIERVKLLLQTQDGNAALLGRSRRFRGFFDCVARTVREEGALSLWRGNGTAVIRYYPSVALNFSLKDLYRSILKDAGTSADNKFTSIALTNFVAGAAAGCTTLVIIYPLDIAHTRLAADIGRTDTRQFKGIRHFIQTIYKKNGIRGIYRGLPASLHGMIVHRGLYFGGFDTAKDMLVPLDSPLWQRWVTAQAVTSTAGLISYPLDTVRRRMMMQSGMEVQMYSSTLDCWRKVYKVEGVKSFYRGALSNMFRSTGAAAILVLYDEVKKFMNGGRL